MVNVVTTKIYKNNQITIPSKIRKELNISEESVINWIINLIKLLH